MRRKLIYTSRFQRGYRRFTRRNHSLKEAIKTALIQLEADAFAPQLGTHKLQGSLREFRACSCGYDCRILFSIEPDLEVAGEEVIVLLSVGSHDDVY
jgi:addiction module RelE/StbE family toxin